MAQQLTIPGGKNKGQPIAQANDNDIRFWLDRITGNLEQDPNKKFADSDRAWCAGARAELERRNSDDAHGVAKAKSAAIQRTAEQQGAPQALAIGRAMGDPAALTAHLSHLADSHHLVSPATTVDALPPGCGVAVSYVAVNASTAKDGPGEVYPLGGGKVGLSGTTLAKIGAAAGIDWDASQSGRLDNGSDPHYCHFRAVGHVRNFDGSVRTLTGEVEIDARNGSPQIDEITTKAKASGRDPASQILELRKFLLRHAESKAKNRAIASMGLKRSYVPTELGKPFAVCRLMWTGQTDDPELRRVFAEKTADAMIGGMASLYGKPPPQPAPAPHALPAPQRFEQGAPQFSGHAPPPVLAATAPADDDDMEYDTGSSSEPQSSTATPLPQTRQQQLPNTGSAKEF